MSARLWCALLAMSAWLACLQTEGPQPRAARLQAEVEDDSPGPGGDDDAEPFARASSKGCRPLTCVELGATCGSLTDGCGDVVQCGDCAEGEACGLAQAGRCGPAESPRSCAVRTCGSDCGLVYDGCSGVLDCGVCR